MTSETPTAPTEPDPLPEPIAHELRAAVSSNPGEKQPEHWNSRRVLFTEVDRLIRGRVRDVIGDVVLEFKQELDRDAGLDALRKRVERVADGVAKDVDALSKQVETLHRASVERLLRELQVDAANDVARSFERKVTALVAKEVGKQLTGILSAPPAKPRSAKKRAPKRTTKRAKR
jgi:hypothetical protein